jgi:hypothetical protein
MEISMFLVLKRFAMDDVPVLLTDNRREALLCAVAEEVIEFATEDDQHISGTDIGTELCRVTIIEFDQYGLPT